MNLKLFNNEPIPEISPEMHLLNLSARMDVDNHAEAQISALLNGAINWKAFQELVMFHRVTPLVYRTFQKHNLHQIPADVLDDLRRQNQANSARNLVLTHELFKLIDLFELNDISVIPIKGPALAQQAYGDLALRQFDDLDLLIHEGDVEIAHSVLREQHFKPVLDFEDASKMKLVRLGGQRGFRAPDDSFYLDLQWNLFGRQKNQHLHSLRLWEQTSILNLGGRQVQILPKTILLIQMSIHGMQHLWLRKLWLSDFVQVLQSLQSAELERAYAIAEILGTDRFIHIALILANEWHALETPAFLADQIMHDKQAHSIAAEIIRSQDTEQSSLRSRYLHVGLHFKARRGWENKIGFLVDQLFSPSLEDLSTLDLPVRLSFLYYVLRPFRIMLKYSGLPSFPYFARLETTQHD